MFLRKRDFSFTLTAKYCDTPVRNHCREERLIKQARRSFVFASGGSVFVCFVCTTVMDFFFSKNTAFLRLKSVTRGKFDETIPRTVARYPRPNIEGPYLDCFLRGRTNLQHIRIFYSSHEMRKFRVIWSDF